MHNHRESPFKSSDYGEADMDEYMTTAEVAEKLRTPTETVRYWRHVGKGPSWFKLGRRVLYTRTAVEAFVAEAQAAPGRVSA
jgi:excisionase family DNA binding protein